MRIWHFCPSPVSFAREQGGVANVVRALSAEMAASGHDVTVVCGDHELGRPMQQPGEDWPMPGLRIVTLKQRGNPALGPVAEVSRIAASLGANDVAHVHTCFSAFSEAAMGALARADVPFLFSPHGKLSEAALHNRGLAKRLWWAALSKRRIAAAARIGVNATGEAADAERSGLAVPTVMISNGCSPPEGDHWRASRPTSTGRYVLFLGYLDPRKRPELLIETFAQPGMPDDVTLVLAGPDHYGHGDELRRLAGQAGIERRVVFHGPVYGAEKWRLIAGAECLCLPSRAEGMPLVLAEAVGAYTPIVVSPQCNASAITDADAGIEVADATPAAWAASIGWLLASQSRVAMMRAAAARIAPDYRWDGIAARWVDLYRTVAAERHREVGTLERARHRMPANQRASGV